MSLIDMKGNALSPEHKRAHDSERIMSLRHHLNELFRTLQKGWMSDNSSDPTGATVPNEQAIDQYYIGKWVEQCTTTMNSTDPVDVDPEAMATWILEQRRVKAMERPLVKLMDMEPYGFRLVGVYAKGDLWVSTECALWLHTGGLVHVVARMQHEDQGRYLRSLLQMLEAERTDLVATDYTMKELMGWMRAMRRERPAYPDEALLMTLRTACKELADAQATELQAARDTQPVERNEP